MKKIIPASYHRNVYDKATFEDAIVYTVTLPAATATKVTNNDDVATCTRITLAGANFTPTSTRFQFSALRGNLPWSSYSKFTITNPRTTSPSIPSASLPKPGSIVLLDAVTQETETIYYGSISWTSQTAGFLNNIKRGATPTTFLLASPSYGYFTNVVPVREHILIWNNTGAILYMGYDGSLNNTPTNAVEIPIGASHGLWLEPLADVWLYSAGGGAVNIAEYR